MSKYIDAERLNMEWQTLKPFGVTDTMIENLKWIVDRQPTIEVSEDCISKANVISALSLYRNLLEREFASKPTVIADIVLGIADDCIELVETAPSATTEQSSTVGERIEE